jgi:hypothetical protein
VSKSYASTSRYAALRPHDVHACLRKPLSCAIMRATVIASVTPTPKRNQKQGEYRARSKAAGHYSISRASSKSVNPGASFSVSARVSQEFERTRPSRSNVRFRSVFVRSFSRPASKKRFVLLKTEQRAVCDRPRFSSYTTLIEQCIAPDYGKRVEAPTFCAHQRHRYR